MGRPIPKENEVIIKAEEFKIHVKKVIVNDIAIPKIDYIDNRGFLTLEIYVDSPNHCIVIKTHENFNDYTIETHRTNKQTRILDFLSNKK